MTPSVSTPVELSAEAALELEELKQGHRHSAPALSLLFSTIRTPASSSVAAFDGQSGVSMLADVRAYTVLRDSARLSAKDLSDFVALIDRYMTDLEQGVRKRDLKAIDEAKRFCLSLSETLLQRKLTEVYQRRDRAEGHYAGYESL